MRTLFGVVGVLVAAACVSTGVECGPDTVLEDGLCLPADVDTDTDIDTDADADTDADTDTDTDTDSTTTAVYEVCAAGGAPYADIQSAIEDAVDGTLIDICPGTYVGVDIVAVDVELRGADRATTTIDGGQFYPAVRIENAVASLSGLTLTGSTTAYLAIAALEVVQGSTVTVMDVSISGVDSEAAEAFAVYHTDSDLWFEDVLIERNQSNFLMYEGRGGSVTMKHCVIRDNDVGALMNFIEIETTVTNNLFYGNQTGPGWNAIYQYNEPGDVVMLTMNNTIAENTLSGTAVNTYGDVLFWSNIVADNDSSIGVSARDVGPTYTTVWGHDDNFSSYSVVGVGTIEQPPIFTDAGNHDFGLDPVLSPCVDAGDPDAVWKDADGTRNDMGAFGGPEGDWTPPP